MADRINYLNIGLMLLSCGVALFIPFELFLFAYAILGPAHYLTEISWLEKRRFFTPNKHDFWLLAVLAVLLFVSGQPAASQSFTFSSALYTALALGAALVLVLTDKPKMRLAGLAIASALAFILVQTFGFLALLMALFVPTLIHVYLFTGFFMLYGALKERSRSGYLAFAIFLLCPVLCYFLDPLRYTPSNYVVVSYWLGFSKLNLAVLGLDVPTTKAAGGAAALAVFSSTTGLILMRFIAFAYTYHYFNWFSKTSIIKWHEVGRGRLAVIALLWAAAAGIYIYDYTIGVKVLFGLSVLHVYLEFPLNHISIMGTFRELKSRVARPALAPALER
ncbi:MAG: hypothetical protein HYX27_11515 [Acidobacteria bacterium]|nr:hypothetical protein [Acidobacteriota bacterium]